MANKVIGDYSSAITIDGANHYLLIQPGNSSTAYNKINRNVFLGVTGQPADISSSQSITNKTLDNTNTITLKDTLFTLQDDSDTSKQAKFQLSSITTATTRTYTLPNVTDTLVSLTATQTLTNKTITAPTITGGTIDNTTITVDSIAGHSTSTIVTVANMQISNGVINTANAVTSTSIAAGAVQPQALQSGTGSGWTLQSYSPTFANLTTGNGTLTAHYIQIGKSVFYHVEFQLGSTSSVSSNPTITLPVTAVSSYATNVSKLGDMTFFHASDSSIISGAVIFASTTTMSLNALGAAGTYTNYVALTASIPFSWTTSDKLVITGWYEAA